MAAGKDRRGIAKGAGQGKAQTNSGCEAIVASTRGAGVGSSANGSFYPPWWKPRTTSLPPHRTATSVHISHSSKQTNVRTESYASGWKPDRERMTDMAKAIISMFNPRQQKPSPKQIRHAPVRRCL